ncbi:unnamed protein product [Chondrus crispus]|uniref:Delta(14)-sterol reductase n=1 Tax=Chondrus crispus TaxID=2769 RepID=R7QDA0_CHOCR|nr:unnamed protein product [Chondrus crispus]CDF35421.1 unnamed protein product [Chondrus crispus]|eukprot:XP_005715240.1 unnamed protein product [Chondrus crispus]
MKWAHGYLLLCSATFAVLFRDLLPLLPYARLPVPTVPVVLAFLGYVATLAVLGAFLPGKTYAGAVLPDGSRLTYKCNGLQVVGVVVTALAVAHWSAYWRATWVVHHYAQLLLVANAFALALSVYLCVAGRLRRPRNWLRSTSLLADFVMGAELNPTVLAIDVKFFSYRPAMAGWLIVNLSFLAKQLDHLGFITSRMLLYQLVTAWYIWDYFVHEPKIVSTWDIIAEHFGLMLVWGDYVFIVFAFSVQNFFLLDDTRPLSYLEVALIAITFSLGFAVFRGANSQKHQFKTQPKTHIWGKPPITVGDRLLASGFWGIARHMNYTGDLMLALSFSLPCGRASPLAYFYFFYLLLLTVHREMRDDQRCSRKYKSLWDEYCLQVPYRMVPFVY